MAKLICSAIASLDGYVADDDGNFDWAAPDEEVHAFINDLDRRVGTYLYGRRMYETMAGSETDPTLADGSLSASRASPATTLRGLSVQGPSASPKGRGAGRALVGPKDTKCAVPLTTGGGRIGRERGAYLTGKVGVPSGSKNVGSGPRRPFEREVVESVVGAEVVLGTPLVLALELLVLYAAGSYAMGRLMGLAGSGGMLARPVFYLLVFPGVALHESAHYLACLLTGTEIFRFAPFSPQRSTDGRLVLGYVRHERRAFPIRAIIGLAPVLLNPLGLLLATALLTPLTFEQVANPSVGILLRTIFASGFTTDAPLLAAVWAYLSLSLALGSVPSREDLSGLPLLLAVLGAGILLFGFLRSGTAGRVLSSAAYDVSALAAGLYALPAAVALSGAVAMGLLARPSRW